MSEDNTDKVDGFSSSINEAFNGVNFPGGGEPDHSVDVSPPETEPTPEPPKQTPEPPKQTPEPPKQTPVAKDNPVEDGKLPDEYPTDPREIKWGELRNKASEADKLKVELAKVKAELDEVKKGVVNTPEDYEELKAIRDRHKELTEEYEKTQKELSVTEFTKSNLYKAEVKEPYDSVMLELRKLGDKNSNDELAKAIDDLAINTVNEKVEDYDYELQSIIEDMPIVAQQRAIQFCDNLKNIYLKHCELMERAEGYKVKEQEKETTQSTFNLFMEIPIEVAEQYSIPSDIDSVPQLIDTIEKSHQEQVDKLKEENEKLNERVKRMTAQKPNASPSPWGNKPKSKPSTGRSYSSMIEDAFTGVN